MTSRRLTTIFTLWALAFGSGGMALGQGSDPYVKARQKLVAEVLRPAGVTDENVLQAMLTTRRHEFVAPNLRDQAYFDMALPIGEKQTISSPQIVAQMTQALSPQPTDKVLEIGTGSGYQAAVLSPLVDSVYTIEIVEPLGRKAAATLKRLQYRNVFVKVGDGYQGWPEHAPFDKIIVTCSPENVPQPLVDQLKEGGLMVIPVGERYQQTLTLCRKAGGKLETEALRPTLFVPMTGAAEANRQVKPDPANPAAVNGDFEEPLGPDGFISGWYYHSQAAWKSGDSAPEGQHYVTFTNEQAGRSAHLLQGFGIDGRQVRQLELSAWVKSQNVKPGANKDELPAVAISLYDDQRRELGFWWLGPFRGTGDWKKHSKTVQIPTQAREGILRIGLFGATGEISFDDVQMTPSPR